jgi:toxin ParE1/3/4
MEGQVPIHDRAILDLAEHIDYIAQNSPQAARRFLFAAQQTFEQLSRMPGMGTRCEFRNPAAAGLRFWRVEGFRNHFVIYRPLESGIEVVRVLHAARDWEAIFE